MLFFLINLINHKLLNGSAIDFAIDRTLSQTILLKELQKNNTSFWNNLIRNIWIPIEIILVWPEYCWDLFWNLKVELFGYLSL